MIENFEYKGEWFLPHSKNKRISGILKYTFGKSSTLELFGSFEDMPIMPKLKDEDIIQGITSNSKKITLYKCYISTSEGISLIKDEEAGNPITVYTVNFILEGALINKKDEIKFNQIISEIHNLDEWVGISGFIPIKNEFEKLKKFEIDVSYKLPEPIRFKINDNIEGKFNFIIKPPGWSIFQKNINLNQRVQIVLLSKTEIQLEDILKKLFTFQNFLILALYKRTYPKSITLYSDKIVKKQEDGKKIKRQIKLYLNISNSNEIEKTISITEMLFGYGHIRDDFESIIKNWFKKHELLEPAFNLLFEQFYNSGRFNENTFLNLAQAAETFHSRTHNHTRMPKLDYNEMKKSILSLAPKKYHSWLRDQFSFGNNLNLHTRLTEIVTKCSNDILNRIIGDKEIFVKQVKWSRNYYTHYSSDGEKKALKGIDLFFLSERLKIVLVCAFLIEVGFDKDKLERLLEQGKHRFFNHLVKW